MKILITGASGLLGFTVALESSRQHNVYGVTHTRRLATDAFISQQWNLLAPSAVENLLETTKPDWVIHCAALANLDACEANPTLAEQLNTELPAKLARNVARGGARLVFISTDSVFDGLRGAYSEVDQPNPQSIYATTKWYGEMAVAEADPQAIIARVNLFGWSLTGTRSLAEFFFNNLQAGNRVSGFTDVFFCPLLVNDLSKILLAMIEKKLQGLYHVVSREAISKYDFGVALAKKFHFDEGLIEPCSVHQANLKAPRSPNLTLLTDKLTNALGKEPPGITRGLDKFHQLYKQGYPQTIKKMVSAA